MIYGSVDIMETTHPNGISSLALKYAGKNLFKYLFQNVQSSRKTKEDTKPNPGLRIQDFFFCENPRETLR